MKRAPVPVASVPSVQRPADTGDMVTDDDQVSSGVLGAPRRNISLRLSMLPPIEGDDTLAEIFSNLNKQTTPITEEPETGLLQGVKYFTSNCIECFRTPQLT